LPSQSDQQAKRLFHRPLFRAVAGRLLRLRHALRQLESRRSEEVQYLVISK
jgi:hypothetical protein